MIALKALSLFVIALAISSKCLCKVSISKTKVLVMPTDISTPLLSAETSQKIQPKVIAPNESGSEVVSKIADNSFSLWWENTPMRNTTIGQAANTVEKKMNAEVSFKDNSEQKTEHKISFKILAMQALAKLEYKGWFKGGINYDAKASTAQAEVFERIFDREDIVLSHAMSPIESRSQVSLRFDW
ncbi:MAG: hypothetical protein WA160_12160 [Pseudobdellovibrio sp.]